MLLAIVTCITFFLLEQKINKSIKEHLESTLKTTSEKAASEVYNELMSNMQIIKVLAADLGFRRVSDVDNILDKLQIYTDYYGYHSMSYTDLNGICYTTDDTNINAANDEWFKQSVKGETVITESYQSDIYNDVSLNMFCAPVIWDNEVKYIISSTYESDYLMQMINDTLCENVIGFLIVNGNGQSIADISAYKDTKYSEAIKYTIQNSEIDPKIIENGENSFAFLYNGTEYMSTVLPLNIEDWYIVTYISEDDAYSLVREMQKSIFTVITFMWCMIVAVLIAVLVFYYRLQKKIRTHVFIDDMLGEKNYIYFKLLYHKMSEEERNKLHIIAFDIDKFKYINLCYGAQKGDEILRYICKGFHEVLPDVALYRDRADRFVAVVKDANRDDIEQKLTKILQYIDDGIQNNVIIPFDLSFGVCDAKGAPNLNTVYTNAVIATTLVKNNPLIKYAFFDDEMRAKNLKNIKMESSFAEAIENGEFHVYYQPKFDMRTREIVGSEALVRWIKEDGTVTSPDEFIPCFEASGQIAQLDAAVLRIVCKQMREMMEMGIDIKRVSMNLSRFHLVQPFIIHNIKEMINELDIDPANLAFEITESAVQDNYFLLEHMVREIHSIGCTVNMDDYGKGISSLQSLSNVDFDVIKLDKSFVDQIGTQKMECVIRSTIELAKMLNLQLIAEGIETKQQRDFLVENGCYYAQGFYYSKPVPVEEYRKLLEENSKK